MRQKTGSSPVSGQPHQRFFPKRTGRAVPAKPPGTLALSILRRQKLHQAEHVASIQSVILVEQKARATAGFLVFASDIVSLAGACVQGPTKGTGLTTRSGP